MAGKYKLNDSFVDWSAKGVNESGYFRLSTLERVYCSTLVKQHLTDSQLYYCNTLLPPLMVYGIHVLNEGNRIEFLLA